MQCDNLDWTNRNTEDALFVDSKVDGLINTFGLQLMLEATLHRINVLILQTSEDSGADDYLYNLKASLEQTLDDYKNRYESEVDT